MRLSKNDTKLFSILTDYTRKCKCSHSLIITPTCKQDYLICDWYGRRVFKNDSLERKYNFIERMKGKLK